VVEVSHPDLAKVLDEQSEDEPGNRLRRAMATIIEIAGDKPLEALCDSEGKRALANEIKGALNDLLAKEDKGMITDVYFAGFLVQ
jgi:flagellar basal body-associated protein FliL